MAGNYSQLKSDLQAVVKENHEEYITGQRLQEQLIAMINSLGTGYQCMGIATPTTNPGAPDEKVFYIASAAGTYSNFGSPALVVNDGEVAILKWDTAWHKEVTGAATAAQVTELGQDIKETYGDYVDNPEWVRIVTDANDRILYGVKTDGKFYFGAGCPPQVREYIQTQLDTYHVEDIDVFLGTLIEGDNLATLLNGKVDKVTGKSLIDADFASAQEAIENPEWLQVTTDSVGKVLGGIKKDGSFVLGDTTMLLNDIAHSVGYEPLEEGDFVIGMDKSTFVQVYNSKLAGFAALCKCNVKCMYPLRVLDTGEEIINKINHNFRNDVVFLGMSEKVFVSQLNKYFQIPIFRFADAKYNQTAGINASLIVTEDGQTITNIYEPSCLISEDGQTMELFVAGGKKLTSSDGVNWTSASLSTWLQHPSFHRIDGKYLMVGGSWSGGRYLNLMISDDGLNYTLKGHLYEVGSDIGNGHAFVNLGNSYLFKDNNGTFYLYYEGSEDSGKWEFCLMTTQDDIINGEPDEDGFIGEWTQCSENPIFPYEDNNKFLGGVSVYPGNPEFVKGQNNAPLKLNGKFYMYYHIVTKDPGVNYSVMHICRAYSYDLVHWIDEGIIFDNRDIPENGEEYGDNADQCLCEFKGHSYLFYSQNMNGSNTHYIEYTIDDRPFLELLKIKP